MKKLLAAILLVFCGLLTFSNPVTDSLLNVLDWELTHETQYVQAKMNHILELKMKLDAGNVDLEEQYQLFDSIFEYYKSFNYDSSFFYISQLQKISYRLNQPIKIASAKIKLGFIFLSSGMFKEAFDSLGTVNPKLLPGSFKPEYYSTMAIFYYGLADLQDKYYAKIYETQANQYVDSTLLFAAAGTYTESYYSGLRYIRSGEFDLGLKKLSALRGKGTLNDHQNAIICSTLSDIFINRGNQEKAIELLAEAAISDIKSATRETAAILNLANILHRQGELKRAYTYTKRALDYANYYGARHRKIQVGSILPIIEEDKINAIEGQKRMLFFYSLIVTVLIFIIILFIVITLRQLKKLRQADKALMETNNMLQHTNEKLLEANKIKEEYIGYYFNINSNYIDKMEHLKTSIEKNLASNKYDNVRYLVERIDLKKDRISLYQGFDKVFLKLFPDFVKEFNALFEEKDRIQLSGNELLNTDLRIFALIRMGISENDKIAKILEFSVNTIYTYKTKIKNKSIVPNEEFEKRIMEIKQL